MTTAQKIYNAIELFSAEEPYYKQFKTMFRSALIDHGTPAANADQMAEVAAESLRDHTGQDHHLGMAQIIACHQGFERAIDGNIKAFQAMHKYMSYYLDFTDMQQARVAN